jgi:pimeloyl-ACP methyl ester carboxylesterase
MSNLRPMILTSLAILIAVTAVACGAASPTVTPTLENTPVPTVMPTLENTPLPTTSLTSTPTAEGSIDVGGYKLNYQCFGQGTPPVIVEAALGDVPIISLSWQAVTQKIQTLTRICIYDRVDGVRTSQAIAEDLHALLSQIPVPGPYLLVAHSLGGYHVRVFAHLYPADVAGMILVDTTQPDAITAFATAYPTYSPGESPGITHYRDAQETPLPPDRFGGLDFNASTEQVRQAGSLGDLPLIVISQSPNPNNWAISGFTLEDKQRFAAVWQGLQADLATLSSQGVFLTAKNSNHDIPRHEPQIIIDAITQMVDEIRKH